ncbi:transposase, partial [Candidatus Poribacteria bacterium]
DDSNGTKPYQHIDSLEWSQTEQKSGKRVKINKFPKNHKVKVFRVVSNKRTDYVATNDLNQSDVSAVRQVCSARWKIEQFHRETKQLTGIEKCQCRLPRIVRNHITCAVLVWIYLMQKANEMGQTLYRVKNEPYSDFLRQQLKSPTLKMDIA